MFNFMEKLKIMLLMFSLFFLVFPEYVFAACGDINSIGMFNFAIIVLILFTPFFLVNIDYIKRSSENGKMLILNFAPLIIFPALAYVQVKLSSPGSGLPQQIFFDTLDKSLSFLLIYYILFLFYGISQFYGDNRAYGGDIIKFCISVIIAFSAIYGFLKVIIGMSGC